MTLIADGMGVHVPKGYIYAAMAFLGPDRGVLNMLARRAQSKRVRCASGHADALTTSGGRV